MAKRKEPWARLRRAASEGRGEERRGVEPNVIRTAALSGGADAAFKVVNINGCGGPRQAPSH